MIFRRTSSRCFGVCMCLCAWVCLWMRAWNPTEFCRNKYLLFIVCRENSHLTATTRHPIGFWKQNQDEKRHYLYLIGFSKVFQWRHQTKSRILWEPAGKNFRTSPFHSSNRLFKKPHGSSFDQFLRTPRDPKIFNLMFVRAIFLYHLWPQPLNLKLVILLKMKKSMMQQKQMDSQRRNGQNPTDGFWLLIFHMNWDVREDN